MKTNPTFLKFSLYMLIIYCLSFQADTYFLLASQPHTIKMYLGLYNPKGILAHVSNLREQPISLHFLLPTIGRKSIFKVLNSLQNQIQPQDYVTVIFDGKDQDHVFNKVKIKLAQFSCKTNIIFEKKNLGYWGHSIRNKYNTLPGDFVLHCDDDNVYTANSLSVIRKICNDPTKIYIFRIKMNSSILWVTPSIKLSQIDTSNGVIPTSYNNLSSWGYHYGGDYTFYLNLIRKIPVDKIAFVDFVIYEIRTNKKLATHTKGSLA